MKNISIIILSFLLFFQWAFSKEIYKIGFAQDTLDNDWRKAQVDEALNEASKYDFLKLDVKNAKGSLAAQIADIEYFINNDYDFIVTSPLNAKLASKALQKAMNKNIKVILISRGIEGDNFTSFISADNYKIAQKAARFLADKLNFEGTVLMLKGIQGATPTILREKGFMDEISKYPDIKVIKRTANFLRSDAIKVTNDILEQGIAFDGVYSHSDSMLSGFRKALEKTDIKKEIVTVGIDYISEAKEAIIKGEQDASFTYDTCGKEGIQTIVDIINGKKVEKIQSLDSTMVTKQNVLLIKPIF